MLLVAVGMGGGGVGGGSAQARSGGRAADDGPVPGTDWRGPEVTQPQEPPREVEAGRICSFPIRMTFPVNKQETRTWKHPDGSRAYAVTTGALVMRVTNKDTGRTVTRDIGGSGSQQWLDKNTQVMAGDHWGMLMPTGFDPPGRFIIASDLMSVLVRSDDQGRTTSGKLLSLEGRYEDLCQTLTGKKTTPVEPSGGAVPGTDWSGPAITHPAAAPRQYAAGELCAFPMRLTFPKNRMVTRSWHHPDGTPAYSTTVGALDIRATRTDTGRSVRRDIGGSGAEFWMDGGRRVQGGDRWGGLMTDRYRPPNRLIVSSTYMSFLLSGEGKEKSGTLLALRGPREDLCRTLG